MWETETIIDMSNFFFDVCVDHPMTPAMVERQHLRSSEVILACMAMRCAPLRHAVSWMGCGRLEPGQHFH